MKFLIILLLLTELFFGLWWGGDANEATVDATSVDHQYPQLGEKCKKLVIACGDDTNKELKCFGNNDPGYQHGQSMTIICPFDFVGDCENMCLPLLTQKHFTWWNAAVMVWWIGGITPIPFALCIGIVSCVFIYKACFKKKKSRKAPPTSLDEFNESDSDESTIAAGQSFLQDEVLLLKSKIRNMNKEHEKYSREKRKRLSLMKRQIGALKETRGKLIKAVKVAKETVTVLKSKLERYRKECTRLKEELDTSRSEDSVDSDDESSSEGMMTLPPFRARSAQYWD